MPTTCTHVSIQARTFGSSSLQHEEIALLKVGDIDLTNKRVFIRGEISKIRNDDMVEISPQLAKIIKATGIMNYPANYYVLGKSGVPGEQIVNDNFFLGKTAQRARTHWATQSE